MSFSILWIDTAEVKLTQNVMILFPSTLCNLPSKLTFLFFKWSLWFLLTSLRALNVTSNSFPNYLLQMQTSPPTIKLFDLKRLGDYGRRQFSTCFNDFVSLTLWINLLLDLKIKLYCITIIKDNFITFCVTLTTGKFFFYLLVLVFYWHYDNVL